MAWATDTEARRTESPERSPRAQGSSHLGQGCQDRWGGKASLFSKRCQDAGHPRTQGCWTPTSHKVQKPSKWIKDVNVNPGTVKLLENMGQKLHSPGLDEDITGGTPKA